MVIKKRVLDALADMRPWITNARDILDPLDGSLTIVARLLEAIANMYSPKAQVLMPTLKLAAKTFTGSWKQLLDVMEKIVELLEEDIGVSTPVTPSAAPPPKSTPKN